MLKHILAVVAAATLSIAAHAAAVPAVNGKDYLTLDVPQPVSTGKKIEVTEFFWYRCPHCNALEPDLVKWTATMPKDAQLVHIPVVFQPNWMPAAKLFYALQDVGAAKLHDAVFDAYHVEDLDLDNQSVLLDWVAKHGIDRNKFLAAYNSFSTQSRAMQASMVARNYDLKGVPTIAVDGHYVTAESMTGSPARLFEVVDQLIAKARKDRAAKAAHRK
jgi:thiol:disulfide interchange protein DsbA